MIETGNFTVPYGGGHLQIKRVDDNSPKGVERKYWGKSPHRPSLKSKGKRVFTQVTDKKNVYQYSLYYVLGVSDRVSL